MKKEIKVLSEFTQRREDSSKKKTPDKLKKLDHLESKKDLLQEKGNQKNNDKFKIAYKKLIVKSILFNYDKNWFDDTMKDLKKLEAAIKITDQVENVFMFIFFAIIDFHKGNIKNFCHHIDNILINIDKLSPESLNNELDEHFLALTNKIVYSQVKNNIFMGLDKVALFENFTSFIKIISNKDHLINFLLSLAVTFLSKNNSFSNERTCYLRILRDNLNNHINDKNDNFSQLLLLLMDKLEASISNKMTRTNNKDKIINISRNTKSKDVSNNSKPNNSFESTKNQKEENIKVKLKDNKISNFQKYIKNIKNIKEKVNYTHSSTKKITKSSNFSKDNKKTNSESKSNISKEISDLKKTNVLVPDETICSLPAKLDNHSTQLNVDFEKSEKYNKVLAQSNPHSNKSEISLKNKFYLNNLYTQKPNKMREILSPKNRVLPININEKANRINNSLNFWTKNANEENAVKTKINKICSYFKDLDTLNTQFSDQIMQCKIAINNLK